MVETAFNASRDEHGYPIKGENTKVDLVIPVLQEFLSSVEVLVLGTESTPNDVNGLDEDHAHSPLCHPIQHLLEQQASSQTPQGIWYSSVN